MPPIGKAPGLKRGRILKDGTPLWYWMARQVVRDPRGYPDKCVPLRRGADADEIARLCHEHTARLLAWLEQLDADPSERSDKDVVARYDGTMASAIALYRDHSMSRFNAVKHNTRRNYDVSLRLIGATVGARLIRNLTAVDVLRWHAAWRQPAREGGPERLDRAHTAVTMVRLVWGWGSQLAFKDCAAALERIAGLHFERGSGRDQEMTAAHVSAFVRVARELGERGVQPADRMLHMAIGVATQFELGLRQRDVIGEWVAAVPGTPGAIYDGKGQMWRGQYRWDNIPGWKLRLKTSKTRAGTTFTLTDYPRLSALLDLVPIGERTGAIVKGERDLPAREHTYRMWFRQVARAAEMPDEVWLMDSRAGAATEASEAGVPVDVVQDMMTHSKARQTQTYIRRRERTNAVVAEARAKHRAKQGGEQ